MKPLIVILSLILSLDTAAQNVAINNDASQPDNSAILDIKSNSKGILIPRMNLAALLAIANPANGLLVLDTAKNQLMVNMGTPAVPNWQTILAKSGWSIEGNSGTDAATNFIGTTDNKPFTIRVNNKRSGFIYADSYNTSFGYQALDSFTTGKMNTAAGYKAMFNTKTGTYNTALGTEALFENSSGSFNTASGVGALNKNTIGNQNTAFGQIAMYFNTSGNRNTGTGSDVLRYNVTGSDNAALGYGALYFNTSGNANVGIGTAALFNTGNRSFLVAVGDSALFNNGIGAVYPGEGRKNTALGSKALFKNTTGGDNTGTGYNSLFSNTTGYSNTSNGVSSLFANTTGYQNTGSGSYALIANTTGNFNTAQGASSLASNTKGDNNTASGSDALFNNISGNKNTASGYMSLYSNTTGNNNTAIGYAADVSFANLSNATAIGYNAKAAVSNSLVLGGTGTDAVNVGIGTTTPGFPLNFASTPGNKISLYGNTGNHYGFGVQAGLLQIHSDAATADIVFGYGGSTSLTENMRIKGNGNVGIGNSNPNRPLSFPATLGEKILLYPGVAGEVGIGVYGNELRLHADNANAKISFGTQDNSGIFSENALAQRNGIYAFSVLGSLWVNGTTYASDARFKQNITAIESPLQKLMQLNGVEYEMKTEEFPNKYFQPGRQMGLLAQDVEKIVPEAVNEKDGYKGVDYARLVPLLIESIKELKKEIDALKKNN